MTDDGLATPLPLRDSQDIQGNILAGFNKDQQTFLFLRFGDPTQGRAYLKALTPRLATTQQVTTFNEQFSAARRLRGGDDPERLKAVWVNIGLTHHGLITLGPGLRRELRDFSAFTQGPAARAADLADIGLSAPQRWILGVPGQTEVDVILTVAADDDNDLLQEVDRQRTLATAHGLMVIFEQRGETLCGDRAGHEHFGFKDGVSQPGVIGYHESDPDNPSQRKDHPGTEMIEAGEFILGLVNESGSVTPVPRG
jgi:deferrochelatase/peroxidase EfeB